MRTWSHKLVMRNVEREKWLQSNLKQCVEIQLKDRWRTYQGKVYKAPSSGSRCILSCECSSLPWMSDSLILQMWPCPSDWSTTATKKHFHTPDFFHIREFKKNGYYGKYIPLYQNLNWSQFKYIFSAFCYGDYGDPWMCSFYPELSPLTAQPAVYSQTKSGLTCFVIFPLSNWSSIQCTVASSKVIESYMLNPETDYKREVSEVLVQGWRSGLIPWM